MTQKMSTLLSKFRSCSPFLFLVAFGTHLMEGNVISVASTCLPLTQNLDRNSPQLGRPWTNTVHHPGNLPLNTLVNVPMRKSSEPKAWIFQRKEFKLV